MSENASQWGAIENYLLTICHDQPDSETMIWEKLKNLAKMQGLQDDEEGMRHTFREVRRLLQVPIDAGDVLTNSDPNWQDWFNEAQKNQTDSPHSDAYDRYLSVEYMASTKVLNTVTDGIMRYLADPRRDRAAVKRRGLIIGDVQSGKTRTYMGLMNKAVDYGYKLIIVLTSDNEDLRRQTQNRINTDFLGTVNGKIDGIGIYLPKGPRPISLTGDDDFGRMQNAARSNDQRPNWDGTPSVAVMKKNGSVLRKFINWLSVDGFEKDLPVLIIDDESDYASVNSSKDDDNPTRINGLLRKLCNLSERTSYVAVTATPFANIFINDETEDDLFPENFIYILPTPEAYIGANRIFGDRNQEDVTESDMPNALPPDSPARLLDLEEFEEWLPLTHKKTFEFATDSDGYPKLDMHGAWTILDDQVRFAINCFLVACALRQGGDTEHQSMLLHLSRYVEVQRHIADAVYSYISDLENALRFHTDDSANPYVSDLRHAFTTEYTAYADEQGVTWDMTLTKLLEIVRANRIMIRLKNTRATDWNDLHGVPATPLENECTIYVGGNQLSRGMTLDGLICSVFYRRVTAADTLLQMGRWFGYRNGYASLQRIWLLPQTVADFKYSSSILDDIKQNVKEMQGSGMTPKDFGFAIKQNPNDGVRITNPGKMRNAEKTDIYAQFDLSNNIIESVRLSDGIQENAKNDAALDRLLDTLDSMSPQIDAGTGTTVYAGVPQQAVTDFLKAYRAGYGDTYFGLTLARYKNTEPRQLDTTMVEQYANTQQTENPDMTWNVAFINGSGPQVNLLQIGAPADMQLEWRTVRRAFTHDKDDHNFQVSGNKLRLGAKSDVVKVARVLNPDAAQDIPEGNERKFYSTTVFGNHPTLMLYRVVLENRDKANKNTVLERAEIEQPNGLLAAKIVIPSDHTIESKRRSKAIYYMNTVAARKLYEQAKMGELEDED